MVQYTMLNNSLWWSTQQYNTIYNNAQQFETMHNNTKWYNVSVLKSEIIDKMFGDRKALNAWTADNRYMWCRTIVLATELFSFKYPTVKLR